MSEDRAYETMMDVFRRTNPDGSYFFTDDEVRHFLPWMMIHTDVDLDTLDDGSLMLFAQACADAGVVAGMKAEEVNAKFEAYYASKPPHPELVSGLKGALREVARDGAGANAASFAKFAGTATAKMAAAGAERPEGTIPAGPMARFAKIPPKK